ncbi:excisionase [Bradyrhizobium erythrophlei]|uniref:excisionase n=1 Tax=Bradyrhizobium erythrophlei TaxID=1437360 RepID=UPI001FD96B67|nr:excisionase [Bradyrhizobium erythrophlei]
MTKVVEIGLVARDAPIRLATAAQLAFPDGSMTVSGLRREAFRGRLVTERIAGKDFTTLENIDRMRELCRVRAKEPGFTNGAHDLKAESLFPKPFGSSETAKTISPRDALEARLKQSRPKKQSKP